MADLNPLRQQIRRRAEFAVQSSGPTLRQLIQTTSPVESNRMKINSKVEVRGLTARTLIDTEYASFVREGTSPHVIRAKRRALRFYWPKAGGEVFFRSVQHPGTTPNPWYDNALARWPDMLRQALRRAPQ